MAENNDVRFALKFSNWVVEHLGVKLYQNRPTNALAELISNGWDADAETVWVDMHLSGPKQGWWISVGDDGDGMTPTEVQEDYLVIGRNPRLDGRETTRGKGRALMGRKGIGKLAPFGIARLMDVFTIKQDQVTWISLDLDRMLEQGDDPSQPAIYEPPVHLVAPLSDLDSGTVPEPITRFLARLEASTAPSGTLILLRRFTFSSTRWSRRLNVGLANRLIPAFSQPDFCVTIDETPITLDKVVPSHSLRIPAEGWDHHTINGGRLIRSWALVVDLERYKATFNEDWTQEHAGVAVYAHGKIAQDRPFFFGLTGREIFTRYLYGVIEADWVDELREDVISTDRTSLNWGHPDLSELRRKGQDLLRTWLSTAERHKRETHQLQVERTVREKVARVPERYRETYSRAEVQEMAETILSLAPDTSVEKVVDITFSAVAHIPSWDLLKNLVQQVREGALSESVFGQIVFDLRFFENVNLAQVVARRLQALLALERLIQTGAREVVPGEGDETMSVRSMHDLLRNNPWLLDLRWAAVAEELPPQLSREALATAEARLKRGYGDDVFQFESWRRVGQKAMDFVLLHIMEFENVIIIVEIKRANHSLNKGDLRQLQDYMDEVRQVLAEHAQPECAVRGILCGGRIGSGLRNHVQGTSYDNLHVQTWRDLLGEARRSHQEFLRALAVGLHDDPRLRTYLDDLGYTAGLPPQEEG